MTALVVALVLTQWPQQIDSVEVKGVSWTKEFVVLRELPWHAGELVTQESWDLGTTRLWNTDLFSQVQAKVETRGDKHVAIYEFEERFSLNPLFSFGIGGGRWWFRVGANDVNWFGRYLEWGVRYERFDLYNGGQGWLRDPRLFGKRLMGLIQLDYLFRPRPEYVRRRLGGTVEVSGELNDVTRTGNIPSPTRSSRVTLPSVLRRSANDACCDTSLVAANRNPSPRRITNNGACALNWRSVRPAVRARCDNQSSISACDAHRRSSSSSTVPSRCCTISIPAM